MDTSIKHNDIDILSRLVLKISKSLFMASIQDTGCQLPFITESEHLTYQQYSRGIKERMQIILKERGDVDSAYRNQTGDSILLCGSGKFLAPHLVEPAIEAMGLILYVLKQYDGINVVGKKVYDIT